jgi:hypothetical protein
MRRSKARRMTTVGLLVGVLALSVGGAVGALFNNAQVKTSTTTSSTAPTTTLPPISNLGDVGRQLGDLAAAGRLATYAAVYSSSDPELPSGLIQTLELWRKGPHMFRSDVVQRSGDGITRNSNVIKGNLVKACNTVNGKQTCQTLQGETSDLPGLFIKRVVTAKEPPKLTVQSTAVAGYEAKCFTASGVGELCLAGDGSMLEVVLIGPKGPATILLTRITNDVPDSAFDVAAG